MTPTTNAATEIAYWLDLLDAMPLECDGLTRVASFLLHREGVEHTVHVGTLDVEDASKVAPHFWVELKDGRVLDLRARMWLGDGPNIPHGLFVPEAHHTYHSLDTLDTSAEPEIIFFALADRPIQQFPLGIATAFESAKPRNSPRMG